MSERSEGRRLTPLEQDIESFNHWFAQTDPALLQELTLRRFDTPTYNLKHLGFYLQRNSQEIGIIHLEREVITDIGISLRQSTSILDPRTKERRAPYGLPAENVSAVFAVLKTADEIAQGQGSKKWNEGYRSFIPVLPQEVLKRLDVSNPMRELFKPFGQEAPDGKVKLELPTFTDEEYQLLEALDRTKLNETLKFLQSQRNLVYREAILVPPFIVRALIFIRETEKLLKEMKHKKRWKKQFTGDKVDFVTFPELIVACKDANELLRKQDKKEDENSSVGELLKQRADLVSNFFS